MPKREEKMPCPRCGVEHAVGDYVERPDLQKPGQKGVPCAPPDVDCQCGARLRQMVPIFAVGPYGWRWKIL